MVYHGGTNSIQCAFEVLVENWDWDIAKCFLWEALYLSGLGEDIIGSNIYNWVSDRSYKSLMDSLWLKLNPIYEKLCTQQKKMTGHRLWGKVDDFPLKALRWIHCKTIWMDNNGCELHSLNSDHEAPLQSDFLVVSCCILLLFNIYLNINMLTLWSLHWRLIQILSGLMILPYPELLLFDFKPSFLQTKESWEHIALTVQRIPSSLHWCLPKMGLELSCQLLLFVSNFL